MPDSSINDLLDKLNGQAARFEASVTAARAEMEKREEAAMQGLDAMIARTEAATKSVHDDRIALLSALEQQLARIATLSAAALAQVDAGTQQAAAHAATVHGEAKAVVQAAGALGKQLAALIAADHTLAQTASQDIHATGLAVDQAIKQLQAAQQRDINDAAVQLQKNMLAEASKAHAGLSHFESAVAQRLSGLTASVERHLEGLHSSESERFGTRIPNLMSGHEHTTGSSIDSLNTWMNGFDRAFGDMNDNVRKPLEELAKLINAIRPVLDLVKQIV